MWKCSYEIYDFITCNPLTKLMVNTLPDDNVNINHPAGNVIVIN